MHDIELGPEIPSKIVRGGHFVAGCLLGGNKSVQTYFLQTYINQVVRILKLEEWLGYCCMERESSVHDDSRRHGPEQQDRQAPL